MLLSVPVSSVDDSDFRGDNVYPIKTSSSSDSEEVFSLSGDAVYFWVSNAGGDGDDKNSSSSVDTVCDSIYL